MKKGFDVDAVTSAVFILKESILKEIDKAEANATIDKARKLLSNSTLSWILD